ncbi:MAG: YebC/PmpR family DNA-binding transcriptional regulator [Candidatus Daviesbacteria bacterium]|nr:MAG: YebC/PmpR family DNA-binding transcriptional regulator [Candidatus Daviesbacteria bacterium]
MSGHSKWSTIKRAKGAADVKRGLTFTKMANAITIAAKLGGSGDPAANPRLRTALDEARAVNMPKDNIARAIDRGLGKGGSGTLEEVVYEGFGPGRVAFIVEGVTDNRLRTNQEIKSFFERNGGTLGNPGTVGYMFDKLGEIKVTGKGGARDNEILKLIDLGAEDVEDYEEENIQRYLVYVQSPELNTMGIKITQAGFTIESQNLMMKPKVLQEVTEPEIAKRVLEFAEKLEGHDDIQKVYANFDIPDNLLEGS